jgi:hypothetical protein
MSYVNMEQIRSGKVPDLSKAGTDGQLSSLNSAPLKKPLADKKIGGGALKTLATGPSDRWDKMQSLYRHTNLNQNLNQVVQKYDIASRQLKDLVDLLRQVNGTRSKSSPKRKVEESKSNNQNPYLQDSRKEVSPRKQEQVSSPFPKSLN